MTPFHRLHALRLENDAAGQRMAEQRPRFTRMAERHTNGSAPQAIAVLQLFQTPASLAARLVAHVRPGSRVLEPSAGLGRLLDALPAGCDVVAVDNAPDCARVLFQQDRPGVRILQRDFLLQTVDDLGTFDAVVMNPPFTMRSDIAHILAAKRFLRPVGVLVALCLDTPHREKALRELASTWEQIPAGTFGKEGTNVPTVLLTMHA